MSKKRTFASYQQLLMAIKRDGLKDAGTTTTLLLETFVYHNGQLKSDFVVEKGLCEKGKFSIWRDELIAKGWLSYSLGDYSKHSPGKKLLRYINKEKILQKEIATIDEVDKKIAHSREDLATKEELKEVKEEVAHLKRVVTQMIAEYDPPVTQLKIKKRMEMISSKEEIKKPTKKYNPTPKEPSFSH